MSVVGVFWAVFFKTGLCKKMHEGSNSAHIQAKWERIKACAGGETISNKTFTIICVLGAIFLTSGINGILAIFLDVEGDPTENKLQENFQVFMILTIISSLFGMWPIFATFYFCIFLRCKRTGQRARTEAENCENDNNNRKGALWTYAWPPFLVWAIFGFIAVGYSWKFAFESDFVIDQEESAGSS